MPRKTKGMTRFALNKLIDGITRRFPADKVFILAQKKYARDELVAVFEAHLADLDAADSAHVTWRAAVASERKAGLVAHGVAALFRALLFGELGAGSAELGHFGWTPPKKPGPKTVAAKLAGVEKGAATRVARKTMGSRQRRKIKGAVAR
jgi:hypothetical protein